MENDAYDAELRDLQIAMIKTQQLAIKEGWKILVILEGRDAAGKDGAIARVTAPLARRETRVVALPKPSDRERTQWYFQRYVTHLPAAPTPRPRPMPAARRRSTRSSSAKCRTSSACWSPAA